MSLIDFKRPYLNTIALFPLESHSVISEVSLVYARFYILDCKTPIAQSFLIYHQIDCQTCVRCLKKRFRTKQAYHHALIKLKSTAPFAFVESLALNILIKILGSNKSKRNEWTAPIVFKHYLNACAHDFSRLEVVGQ